LSYSSNDQAAVQTTTRAILLTHAGLPYPLQAAWNMSKVSFAPPRYLTVKTKKWCTSRRSRQKKLKSKTAAAAEVPPKKALQVQPLFGTSRRKEKAKNIASQCVHRPWLRDGGEAESGGRVPLGGVLGSIRGNFLQGLVHRLRNLGLGGVKVDDDLAKGSTHAHEEVCGHRGLQGGKRILFGER